MTRDVVTTADGAAHEQELASAETQSPAFITTDGTRALDAQYKLNDLWTDKSSVDGGLLNEYGTIARIIIERSKTEGKFIALSVVELSRQIHMENRAAMEQSLQRSGILTRKSIIAALGKLVSFNSGSATKMSPVTPGRRIAPSAFSGILDSMTAEGYIRSVEGEDGQEYFELTLEMIEAILRQQKILLTQLTASRDTYRDDSFIREAFSGRPPF